MKTNTKTPQANSHTLRTVIIVITIVCLFWGGVYAYFKIQTMNEVNKPYPLGDSSKLEYVGRVGYGCWIICDANPSSTYYYATNMSLDETIAYLKKAALDNKPQLGYTSGGGNNDIAEYWLNFKNSNGDTFDAYYYDSAAPLVDYYHLKKTSKLHMINVDSNSYDLFKNSL